MNALNPELYARIERYLGCVGIANPGLPMHVEYYPDYLQQQGARLRMQIRDWGESYRVSCPFCSDTRGRLYISHRWAVHDHRTKSDCLHLATCYNEECLKDREHQMQLHAMLFPSGRYSDRVEIPDKPIVQPRRLVATSLPEGSVSLLTLHQMHPALRYLEQRGFHPARLDAERGIEYCDGCMTCQPPLREARIVIPIETLVPNGEPGGYGVKRVGWQARILRSAPPDGTPKYLTATGTPKSRILYGLSLAIKTTGPIVIVEGPMDAWRVGPSAVAILGCCISAEQTNLVRQHFAGRPVVVWLDADADDKATALCAAVRAMRAAARDTAPVRIAHTPAGRKDPGECNAKAVKAAIAAALSAEPSK